MEKNVFGMRKKGPCGEKSFSIFSELCESPPKITGTKDFFLVARGHEKVRAEVAKGTIGEYREKCEFDESCNFHSLFTLFLKKQQNINPQWNR